MQLHQLAGGGGGLLGMLGMLGTLRNAALRIELGTPGLKVGSLPTRLLLLFMCDTANYESYCSFQAKAASQQFLRTSLLLSWARRGRGARLWGQTIQMCPFDPWVL